MEKFLWTLVFNGFPHPNQGASSVLFFQYLEFIIEKAESAQCIILVESLDENTKKNKSQLLESLQFPLNLELEIIETKTPLLSYTRFSILANLSFKVKLQNSIENYKSNICLIFDFPTALCLSGLNHPNKSIWLGDLMFDTFYYHYKYSIRENFRNLFEFPFQLLFRYNVKKLYQRILKDFQLIIVSSKSSETKLQELGINTFFCPYPWPSNFEYSERINYSNSEIPRYLFYGHLFGLGSRSALHFLFFTLYPTLVKKWGERSFKINIGGRETPPDWVLEMLKSTPEIEYIGFIENLESEFQNSNSVIIPIDVPVGNRSRILTAQSAGAFIVTHKNTSLGNPYLKHLENCVLATNVDEFIEGMNIAKSSSDMVSRIKKSAYETYKQTHHPQTALNEFFNLVIKSNLRI